MGEKKSSKNKLAYSYPPLSVILALTAGPFIFVCVMMLMIVVNNRMPLHIITLPLTAVIIPVNLIWTILFMLWVRKISFEDDAIVIKNFYRFPRARRISYSDISEVVISHIPALISGGYNRMFTFRLKDKKTVKLNCPSKGFEDFIRTKVATVK